MEALDRTSEEGESNRKNIPLKLCFKPKVLLGKSYIHIGLPQQTPVFVTPKFYCKNEDGRLDPEDIEKIKKSLHTEDPNVKFEKPLTENQKYGWYNTKWSSLPPDDPRLDFRIKTNQWIIEHLMNYAKIRK